MEIDLFTYLAQIVNFVLLIWLLKRFLYNPILEAIDRREALIATSIREAALKQEEAEREAAVAASERAELQRQREAMLSQMRDEVAAERSRLLERARDEAGMQKERWDEALRQQKEGQLAALRGRLVEQVLEMARRVVADLAHADLQEAAIQAFVERMSTLDAGEREAARSALREAAPNQILIRSAHEISHEQRRVLVEMLENWAGDEVAPQFEQDAGIGLGLEIRTPGWKIAWNLDRYLEGIEERTRTILEEMAKEEMAPM